MSIELKKKIFGEFDIDETAENRQKTFENSLRRLSRNIGLDYQKKKLSQLIDIANALENSQLENIFKNIKLMFKNYNLSQNTTLILSGIGQDILEEYLSDKRVKVTLLKNLIDAENEKIKKRATYHAPALSIAILLAMLK